MSELEPDVLTRVRGLVQRLSGGESNFEVAWSVISSDPVVTVRAIRNSAHSLTMRVQSDLIVLDIDGSQAIEFDSSGDRNAHELEALVEAFHGGGLEALVGSADGKYYRLRGPLISTCPCRRVRLVGCDPVAGNGSISSRQEFPSGQLAGLFHRGGLLPRL